MSSKARSPPAADDVVILDAVRTPIARAKRGAFKDTTPDVLLATVLRDVLARTGVPATALGEVCVGNVLQGGAGAASSRVAQLVAGVPHDVPLSAVNRQCSSGLQAVAHVAAGIRAGFYDVGIAAGVEVMSLSNMKDAAPAVDWEVAAKVPAAKACAVPMGVTSENVAKRFGVSRDRQDRFAASSHAKAAAAQHEGLYAAELVPVTTSVKGADGTMQAVTVKRDEGVRAGTTAEGLGRLKPAFAKDGTTTAGNSSQVSDGAAAVLLASRARAADLGLAPLGVFRSFAVVGVPPDIMGIGPAEAIPKALARAGLTVADVDIFEINEAFASQAVYCVEVLGIDEARVNPKGGAIALGHPLGCTGARQVATLLHEMRRTGKRIGVVSMCIGTGMGAAAVIELA